MGLLIAARVVQGLVGAPMVPLAMSLILDPSPLRRARRACRPAPASCCSPPALGPAIGGPLISTFGCRSVFLVNVPVGLLALAGVRAARRALPTGGETDRPDRA